jgi:thiamine pyrophosphate-dependent acetolactate synthase large subunit-like protein
MSKRVADVLVETLQAAGVKNCYGIVGDTLDRIAHAIQRSEIDWVHMRHEEAGAFAANAEALLTGRLTTCAGSCGPGSLHFINGLYEANRNRAPVILIATQIVRQDLGFESIQEIDYDGVFKGCSVYCEMIVTPEQARRKTVAACQAALTKRGVAVLVVPADVANADRTRNPRTLFMRAFRSFARVTRTSTRSRRFSTRAARSPSMQAPVARARMTKWSRRRRGCRHRLSTHRAARIFSNTTIRTTSA